MLWLPNFVNDQSLVEQKLIGNLDLINQIYIDVQHTYPSQLYSRKKVEVPDEWDSGGELLLFLMSTDDFS